MVEANLHFFTPKQQKALKESVKSGADADEQASRSAAAERIASGGAERAAAPEEGAAELGDGMASTGAPSRGRESASSSRSQRERPAAGAGAGAGSGAATGRSIEDRGGHAGGHASAASGPASRRRDRRGDVADDSRSRSPVGHSRLADERQGPHSRGDRVGGSGGSRPRRREHRGSRRRRCTGRSVSRDYGDRRCRRRPRPDLRRGGGDSRSDSRSSQGLAERLPSPARHGHRSRGARERRGAGRRRDSGGAGDGPAAPRGS